MPERTCPVCGSTFKPATPNQCYCPPTDGDRVRLKGNAVSRCAKRAANHATRTRQGKTTKPLTSPLGVSFDCEQCGTPCVPGQDGVAAHATRFCGYACKTGWHNQHEDGANRRWDEQRARQQTHERVVARLTIWPQEITGSDRVAYREHVRGDPCAYCGEPGTDSDHIVPKAGAGADDWTNRTSSCKRCNTMKQNVPLLIFLGYKRARDEFEPWRQIVASICTRR